QTRIESFLCKRLLRTSRLSVDVNDRQIVIEAAHDFADLSSEGSRITYRPQCEVHHTNVSSFLSPRCVEERLNLLALILILRICNDSNNLDVTLLVVEGDMLAENFFVRKKLSLKFLTDDRHRRRMTVVLRRETAPTQQRNLH